MNDSKEGKGPLAAIAGILAVAGLGLKAGCAKLVASGGDDALRAASHSAPALGHSGGEAVEAGARAAAHGEEGIGSKIGKEVLENGAQEGAEAAHDAYEDRRAPANASPAPQNNPPPQAGTRQTYNLPPQSAPRVFMNERNPGAFGHPVRPGSGAVYPPGMPQGFPPRPGRTNGGF